MPVRRESPAASRNKTDVASKSRRGRSTGPGGNREAEVSVEVRRSAIQGRGVFATRAIKKGDRIIEYLGERITHEVAGERYDDEAMARHHTFVFTVDDEICIDAVKLGNEAKYINHSCEPNARSLVDRKRVFILATRNIKEGDEVLYDYWYSTDETYTVDDLRRLYPCRCGAEKCRGTLAAVPPRHVVTKPRASARSKASEPRKRNGSR